MAVGDALGTTYEFERVEQPSYPRLATGRATDVVGNGPFGLPAGAVTDDTQLAVCPARSLADRGALDPEDVGRRYVAWMTEVFDIGNQTRWSLERIAAGNDATPGVDRPDHHLYKTGGLVRVALRLAVWHLAHTSSWRDALVDVASRGGDSDTNAAIVGALLGARDGASAIPEAWGLRVLCATQPGSAAWSAAHHPRHLLALVG